MRLPAPVLCFAALLAGCSASLRPAPAPATTVAHDVAVRFHAAPRLNADARGRPLALVVRVYLLRQRVAFDAAPYAAFLTPDAERAALGDDLVAARDVTLVPGQHTALTERLRSDAPFIGVVALFHAPAPGAWRLSLATAAAPRDGLDLELGVCALHAAGTPAPLARCQ